MSETNAQEPTMEEILASIRRIISEDDVAQPAPEAAATPAPKAEMAHAPEPKAPPVEDDVLELTEPVDPPPPMARPAPPPVFEESLGDLDVFSSVPAPLAPRRPAPPPAPADEHEPLVGSYAAEASASHFGALARTVTMPKEGRSLEDVVRDMLKPLLSQWLDTHLTAIVEARVQAEVERISRRHDY